LNPLISNPDEACSPEQEKELRSFPTVSHRPQASQEPQHEVLGQVELFDRNNSPDGILPELFPERKGHRQGPQHEDHVSNEQEGQFSRMRLEVLTAHRPLGWLAPAGLSATRSTAPQGQPKRSMRSG